MGIPSRLEPIAEAVRRLAAAAPRIVAVYLFGSQADSTANHDSDIDLGVLFGGPTGIADRVRLEAQFSEALGADVDLIDVGTCDAFLALSVIRGERLYCTDPVRCDEFDLYVMRRAGDLEFFERQRRSMLLTPATSARA
jgi:predicted nucleotidyltransferase